MTLSSLDLPQRLLTVEEYSAMIEAGILTEDDKVELLEGRIVPMSPSGPSHAETVSLLMEILVQQLRPERQLRVQSSLKLGDLSMPEPDLVVVSRGSGFRSAHPSESDALLVIEVSVSSRERDRQTKAGIYAAAGVPEYWIVLPEEGCLEMHGQPRDGRYTELRTLSGEMIARSEGVPEISVQVSRVVG